MASDRPVVSDTTPLIVLAGVGQLELLPGLYGRVLIPSAVRDEYRAGMRPHEAELERFDWLDVISLVTVDPTLPADLGLGEAAAISLAMMTGARAVLLDEALGRKLAAERGLPISGSLGVLLAGKSRGLIPAIGPVIDEMIRQGRRISPALRSRVLGVAGELPGS